MIGSLGRGGSEKQLSELAVGLAAAGHDVEVVAYDGPGELDEWVRDRGVPVRILEGAGKADKVRLVSSWSSAFRPDVMHGFMKRASVVALLATACSPRVRVVASDFSTASYGRRTPLLWAFLALFGWADRVATQTEMNRESLGRLAPWLRGKTVVVRNGVDTARFSPPSTRVTGSAFRFLCVGSVYGVKNPARVAQAVALLRNRGVPPFRLDWIGRHGLGIEPSREYVEVVEILRRERLEGHVTFPGSSSRIEEAYREADALVHVSLQEGMPNAVVEGMASGLPVIVSRVSDLPLIVAEAQNGFVCDEMDVTAIADAMERMLRTTPGTRAAMGERSRRLAKSWFAKERFIADYIRLYESVVTDA